jgi:hypothetical protein
LLVVWPDIIAHQPAESKPPGQHSAHPLCL